MKFSKRILNIQPSATLSISGKAKTMKAEGKPVISFSAGEPDFNSPKSAREAGIDAINRGESHYTLNPGIIELRQEVCSYYKRRFGLDYTPAEVIIAPGAKPLLYEALQALVDEGDEVILFAPAWVSYVEQLHMAGGVEKVVDTIATGLLPTRESLLAAIGPKTVGLILNSPSNPTGAIYPEETMKMIAEVAKEKDLWIIFDEIYERFAYAPAKHVNILNVAPEIKDRVLIINGVSKAYAMTGWRLGYACGPAPIIKIMTKIHQSAIMSAPTTSQYAAITALKECDGEIDRMRDEYNMRRRLVVRSFNDMGLTCFEPRGAFYAFPCIKSTGMSSQEFCTKLLEQKHVAIIPGDAFGASGEGYCRVSYAYSVEHLTEALKRIREFLVENNIYHGN